MREGEADAGHLSPKKTNKLERTAAELPKKGQFETLNVLEVSKRTCRLNYCFKQRKENPLVITKKNNEPNQILTEVVVVE